MENLGKIMKKYFLIFLTILSYSQNKTIVPKRGAIVFEKKEIITDTLLYRNSFENIFDKSLPEMKKELLKNINLETSKIPDSINEKVNQILEMMKILTIQEVFSNKQKNVVKFHHEYKNSEIIEYISSNGNYFKTNKINVSDSTNNESLFAVFEIKEYKNETKVIRGFKCFKIVINYFDLEQPPGLNKLLNISEIWVTDKIRSTFHPLIKENEILNKYYPLEVKHWLKNVEGVFTVYEISEFSLK